MHAMLYRKSGYSRYLNSIDAVGRSVGWSVESGFLIDCRMRAYVRRIEAGWIELLLGDLLTHLQFNINVHTSESLLWSDSSSRS